MGLSANGIHFWKVFSLMLVPMAAGVTSAILAMEGLFTPLALDLPPKTINMRPGDLFEQGLE